MSDYIPRRNPPLILAELKRQEQTGEGKTHYHVWLKP